MSMPRYKCKFKGHVFESAPLDTLSAYGTGSYSEGEAVCPECGSWAVRLSSLQATANLSSSPATSNRQRCPKCGFSYAWNGRSCDHCKFRKS
jgi:hypothetical protein